MLGHMQRGLSWARSGEFRSDLLKVAAQGLEKAAADMRAARLAPNDDERNRALSKAHDLLASFDSYEPASIGIRNAEPSVISHNWSPGLAAFQYAHNNTFVRAVPGDTLTIPLPPAA